jgi:hypothetical protein
LLHDSIDRKVCILTPCKGLKSSTLSHNFVWWSQNISICFFFLCFFLILLIVTDLLVTSPTMTKEWINPHQHRPCSHWLCETCFVFLKLAQAIYKVQNSIKVQFYQWHHIFFLQKQLITKIGGSEFKNHLKKAISRYVDCLTRIITCCV